MTDQYNVRLDNNTRKMWKRIADYDASVQGKYDLSQSVRYSIRERHKRLYPQMWEGEIYVGEKQPA